MEVAEDLCSEVGPEVSALAELQIGYSDCKWWDDVGWLQRMPSLWDVVISHDTAEYIERLGLEDFELEAAIVGRFQGLCWSHCKIKNPRCLSSEEDCRE